MTRRTAFQTTTDLDLGAAYMVATGRHPAVFREPGNALVSIEMVNDDVTRDLMIAYALGDLTVNVKRFAACRAWIYREIKAVK